MARKNVVLFFQIKRKQKHGDNIRLKYFQDKFKYTLNVVFHKMSYSLPTLGPLKLVLYIAFCVNGHNHVPGPHAM